jgi:putative membrane protein
MKTKMMLATALAIALGTGIATAASSSPDADFVMKAGQANMAEIATGKIAESNGQSNATKAFGKRMIADHTKAGDGLKTAAKKSGAKVPSSVSAEQKADADKLKSEKGADFDTAYAAQAVKDHEAAVSLFQQEASSGSDPDLKAFAAKTLPTLEEHLKMAKMLPAGGGAMQK